MDEDDDERPAARLLDAVFPVIGRQLPRDHRLPLAEALQSAAPWLAARLDAGLVPVNVVHGAGEPAWLSQRARLALRLPRTDEQAVRALAGTELDVAGFRIRLGAPQLRELLPHNTLYAHFVAALHPGGDDEELRFLADVDAALQALGTRARRVCGRRQLIRGDAGLLPGYSLMLHGLAAAESLRVLEAGIGSHRRLGAGLFVPHRSAAAAGG